MTIVSVVIGLGFIFFMLMAFSRNPKKKYYNLLFKLPVYLFHLALSGLLALYGWYRVKNYDVGEVAYFLPLLFLIVFRVFDLIVVKLQGRHILVVTKGDWKPRDYKWWIDGILSFLSVIIPFLLTLFIMARLQQNTKQLDGHSTAATEIHPKSTE